MRIREKKCDENDALERREEELCWAARQTKAGRAGARGVLELERAVSCRRADPWWRTKLDFGSSEPFDDLHWSSTLGTVIKIGNVFGGRSGFFGEHCHKGKGFHYLWLNALDGSHSTRLLSQRKEDKHRY
jgi:hypothetical protein